MKADTGIIAIFCQKSIWNGRCGLIGLMTQAPILQPCQIVKLDIAVAFWERQICSVSFPSSFSDRGEVHLFISSVIDSHAALPPTISNLFLFERSGLKNKLCFFCCKVPLWDSPSITTSKLQYIWTGVTTFWSKFCNLRSAVWSGETLIDWP